MEGGWWTPRLGRFSPGKETWCTIYMRLGGQQGRSRQLRIISPPTGIRSPDHPACSESLYRLSYRGPHIYNLLNCIYWIMGLMNNSIKKSFYFKSTIYFHRHNNIIYLLNFNITYIIILATCFDSYESSSGINFKTYCTYCFTVFCRTIATVRQKKCKTKKL